MIYAMYLKMEAFYILWLRVFCLCALRCVRWWCSWWFWSLKLLLSRLFFRFVETKTSKKICQNSSEWNGERENLTESFGNLASSSYMMWWFCFLIHEMSNEQKEKFLILFRHFEMETVRYNDCQNSRWTLLFFACGKDMNGTNELISFYLFGRFKWICLYVILWEDMYLFDIWFSHSGGRGHFPHTINFRFWLHRTAFNRDQAHNQQLHKYLKLWNDI